MHKKAWLVIDCGQSSLDKIQRLRTVVLHSSLGLVLANIDVWRSYNSLIGTVGSQRSVLVTGQECIQWTK